MIYLVWVEGFEGTHGVFGMLDRLGWGWMDMALTEGSTAFMSGRSMLYISTDWDFRGMWETKDFSVGYLDLFTVYYDRRYYTLGMRDDEYDFNIPLLDLIVELRGLGSEARSDQAGLESAISACYHYIHYIGIENLKEVKLMPLLRDPKPPVGRPQVIHPLLLFLAGTSY